MSLTSPIPNEQGIAFSAAGLSCFYCAEPLTDPAVHWLGASGHLYLHPHCVSALFIRLARDAHEIENAGYYRRREARA